MRRTIAAAVGLVIVASAVPAYAAGGYRGAGYEITGVQQMTVSFVAPASGCPVDGFVRFGIQSPNAKWTAGLTLRCHDGAPIYRLAFTTPDGSAAAKPVRQGDPIRIRLVAAATAFPQVSVSDAATGVEVGTALAGPTTDVGVGALGTPVTSFGAATMKVSANDYRPLADLSRLRHTQQRDGVTQIGSGYPWHDGYHFRIYFRHL